MVRKVDETEKAYQKVLSELTLDEQELLVWFRKKKSVGCVK
jgi:hypothetical protein